MGWIQNFLRVTGVNKQQAKRIKCNLAIVYGLLASHTMAAVLYMTIKQNHPMTDLEKEQPFRYYARLWNADNVQVYTFNGMSFADKLKIDGAIPPNSDEKAVQ